jgi:hypothetical protein
MSRSLSVPMLCALLIPSLLATGGCPEPVVPVPVPLPPDAGWVPQSKPVTLAGALKVDAGPDCVAGVGEVFWLDAQASGGTLPYTFAWSVCSGESLGKKPLICGGDGSLACVTVYRTCRLRVTVTDATGETATSDVVVSVP